MDMENIDFNWGKTQVCVCVCINNCVGAIIITLSGQVNNLKSEFSSINEDQGPVMSQEPCENTYSL